MIRTTIFGLAAAAALAMTAAVPASAGVKFYFGAPAYSGYAPYYPPTYYQAPVYRQQHCEYVIVGYKNVYNGYGYVQVPIKKKRCYYL